MVQSLEPKSDFGNKVFGSRTKRRQKDGLKV